MVRNSASIAVLVACVFACLSSNPSTPLKSRSALTPGWGTSGAGYLTPQKITADEQIMTIMHRGFSYAVDDLSSLGSGADPMAAIRSYLTRAILKLRTSTLLAQLDGLFGTALKTNEVDISSVLTPTPKSTT